MPADNTNPQYDDFAPDWKVMRDTAAGERAVKTSGTDYLPMLGGQDDKEYAAYKMRASYYNATGRTIEGLSGMVFRKAPQIELPTSMDDFAEDVTLSGQPLTDFSERLVDEILTVNRAGILVDYPRVETGGITAAEASRMNLRPTLCVYKAEQILDWKVGQVGNATVLMQVRLMEECDEPDEDDEFESKCIEQIRILELNEVGQYQQRLQRKDKGAWVDVGPPVIPRMNGAPLRDIPFIFVSGQDLTPCVKRPALLDLANVNVSHYRTSADLEHGAHFTALPTPYCFGVDEENEPDTIGPTTLWTGPSKDVTVGLLEFSGAGLSSLEKRLEVKEQQMASLGARMLAPEKRAAETAEAMGLRSAGEQSALASMANTVSRAINKALAIVAEWMGVTELPSIRLNTDYNPEKLSPQMLTAMVGAVQGGQMSGVELFDAMQRGEIVRADKTYDEHEDEIEAAGPPLADFDGQ